MDDKSNHDLGRSRFSKEAGLPRDTNPDPRNPSSTHRDPRTPSEPRAMRQAQTPLAELIAYSPAQNRAQRQRPSMRRPTTGTFRPADVLGQDSCASNLAVYATKHNIYELSRSMADDVHTLGPVIGQLKWKQEKEEGKKRAAEEGISPSLANDEPASGRRSDAFRGPSESFKAFAIPMKRKRFGDGYGLSTDAGNECYDSPTSQLTRWSAQKKRAAFSNSVKELFPELVVVKRKEKLRGHLSPPERRLLRSIINEQQKPLTPPKAFLASLPHPSPIKIPFFIAVTSQASSLPPSLPSPPTGFTSASSQFMMNQLSSPIVASVFIPQGFQAMLDQTSSPNRLTGSQPGAQLRILSVYQYQTIDGLGRDIRRHSNEVDNWFAAWKTPIDLGFDHMILMRDHEMLALRMATEFGRVEEIDARLMRMSGELYDSAVTLFWRTKMFLGEMDEQQEVEAGQEER